MFSIGFWTYSNCGEEELGPIAMDDKVARRLYLTSKLWTRLT